MDTIIGLENAGFEIIEAMSTNENEGFCIGRNKHEYVTWRYIQHDDERGLTFYAGHYYSNSPDWPAQSLARVKADWCRRLADEFNEFGHYGC